MSWQQVSQAPAAQPLAEVLDGGADPAADARAAADEHCIAPLADYGVLALSGADAVDFLHNQITNDVQGLDLEQARLAAYCTPKGRVNAVLHLYREEQGLRAIVPQSLLASLLKRLRMFVLRSKVALADVSDELLVLGVSGAEASERLAALGLPAPGEPDTVAHAGNWHVIRLADPRPRFLLVGHPGDVISRAEDLCAQFQPVGPRAWRLLNIRAGLPEVLPATQETWVPQTLNLDLVGGISFKKGCYPGQEVVARMKYLGKLKRRMYRVALEGAEPPVPGAEVRDAEDKLVGELVSVAPAPDGGSEALAALRMDQLEAALHVGEHRLRVLELPYPVSAETA